MPTLVHTLKMIQHQSNINGNPAWYTIWDRNNILFFYEYFNIYFDIFVASLIELKSVVALDRLWLFYSKIRYPR